MSSHIAVEKPVSVTFLGLSVRRHQSMVTIIEQSIIMGVFWVICLITGVVRLTYRGRILQKLYVLVINSCLMTVRLENNFIWIIDHW